MIGGLLVLLLSLTFLGVQSTYFTKMGGKLVYNNGSEQLFSGFRCLHSGRGIYFSQSLEALARDNYWHTGHLNLEQVTRIDFSGQPNDNVRRGMAKLRDGQSLDKVFFYVEECSWASGNALQGKLSDSTIASLIFTPPLTPPADQSTYFRKVQGRLLYKGGSEQTFNGFRCFYSGRLYFSKSLETVARNNYKSAGSVNLEQDNSNRFQRATKR